MIYEINPNEFYFRNNEANRIKDIFPYYRRDKKIYKLLCQIDPYFRIKKVSKIYLYNQKIFSIFKSYIKKQKVNVSGYRPLYESNMEKIITNYNRKFNVIGNNKNSPKVINTLAKQIFTQFVELCKQNNINLIIIYSPRYSLTKSNINQFPDELINILKKNGLKIYNIQKEYYKLFNNPNLFKDTSHLNNEGAKIFSRIVNRIIAGEEKK